MTNPMNCYCPEYQSSGLPCPPGRCPNVPKGEPIYSRGELELDGPARVIPELAELLRKRVAKQAEPNQALVGDMDDASLLDAGYVPASHLLVVEAELVLLRELEYMVRTDRAIPRQFLSPPLRKLDALRAGRPPSPIAPEPAQENSTELERYVRQQEQSEREAAGAGERLATAAALCEVYLSDKVAAEREAARLRTQQATLTQNAATAAGERDAERAQKEALWAELEQCRTELDGLANWSSGDWTSHTPNGGKAMARLKASIDLTAELVADNDALRAENEGLKAHAVNLLRWGKELAAFVQQLVNADRAQPHTAILATMTRLICIPESDLSAQQPTEAAPEAQSEPVGWVPTVGKSVLTQAGETGTVHELDGVGVWGDPSVTKCRVRTSIGSTWHGAHQLRPAPQPPASTGEAPTLCSKSGACIHPDGHWYPCSSDPDRPVMLAELCEALRWCGAFGCSILEPLADVLERRRP